MKFALYILVAFVFAFAAALPQDVSSDIEMERLDMSEIENLLKEACQGKAVCEWACTLQPEVCPFCKVCDMV